MLIFSGTSNKKLSETIAFHLRIATSPLEIHIFPDGEKRVRVLEKVVDQDVVVVQSTATPVDQSYMELFFIVDALRRSGAKIITAVIPYLGYQRQDHVFLEGEAVSLDVVARALESCGVNKLMTFDLHSIKIPQVFHIPVIHLSALSLFAGKIKQITHDFPDGILISPDMGGIRRIKLISEMLSNMPFATIVKNRDLQTGKVEASEVRGNLSKTAFVVDDMISSGGTIAAAAYLLKKSGVERIFVFATHPVFSEQAPNVLQKAHVEKVFVADTIEVPREKQFEKLEILSVSKLVAEALR